jgi:hypothetical protein
MCQSHNATPTTSKGSPESLVISYSFTGKPGEPIKKPQAAKLEARLRMPRIQVN